LLVGLAGWVRRSPSANLVQPAVVAGSRLTPRAAPELAEAVWVATERHAQEPEEAPATQSARGFLADYYGERWAQVEAAIEASGENLDQPYSFHPWEDVALEFERVIPLDEPRRAAVVASQMQWPQELTVSWVAENYPIGRAIVLSEPDLPELEAAVAATNEELAQLADEWARRIDFYLQERWQSGRYLKAPFTTMGLSQEKGFYSCSHGGYSWALTVTLMREDYPDMVDLEQQAAVLRDERARLVGAFLRARAPR